MKKEQKYSMKNIVLIDADILLDVLMERRPFCRDSSVVWKMCEAGMIKGYISTLSFANIVYIMRKQLDSKSIERVLHMLSSIFAFEPLTEYDLKNAAALHWEDYEDALQYVIAARVNADYIITRNVKDYQNSSIEPLTPERFI